MSFKDNLKEELDFHGILVKELAIKSNISRRTLDNYLRSNESQPTAENAVKIAQALGVTVEYLVTGKETTLNRQKQPEINIGLCKKYYSLIQKIDALEPDSKKVLEQLTEHLK